MGFNKKSPMGAASGDVRQARIQGEGSNAPAQRDSSRGGKSGSKGLGRRTRGEGKAGASASAPGRGNASSPSSKRSATPKKPVFPKRKEPRPVEQRDTGHTDSFSAIDLGTNNCRLLVARPTQRGFRVIDAFSRIVRLGEGMNQNGYLSAAAMDRTIEALKVCADKIARRNVKHMRHVATEACRVAQNAEEFMARIEEEVGLKLDIISAAEEARLAVMGCQSLVAMRNRHALVFDIGGGSTELIWVRMRRKGPSRPDQPMRQSEILGWVSIPWGVVNLSERFGVAGGDADQHAYREMMAEVKTHLEAFERRHRINTLVGKPGVQLLGTSGTVTTLASLHLQLPRYNREKVDGAWMQATDILNLSNHVAMMPYGERAAQPCIGAERADLVVAGCAILEAILSTWAVPNLRVADRGIREGILRSLMGVDPEPLIVRQGRGRRRKRKPAA